MRFTLPLLTLALVGSLLNGCASKTSAPPVSYLSTAQSVVSDRAGMHFKDGEIYFKAPGQTSSAAQFSESLNTCVQAQIAYYQKNGQGVQVFRSLGYTEAQIINNGSRLCMESKGWALYKMIDGNIQQVDHGQRIYAAMSEAEIKSARGLVADQREWYLKYQPDVLAVGDLRK